MIVSNNQGGIYENTADALDRAKTVDLLTLPKDIKGTNCYNCKWIKSKTPQKGYCANPKVAQYVNQHMCCAVWDSSDAFRPYK